MRELGEVLRLAVRVRSDVEHDARVTGRGQSSADGGPHDSGQTAGDQHTRGHHRSCVAGGEERVRFAVADQAAPDDDGRLLLGPYRAGAVLLHADGVISAFAAQHPRAEGVVADDTIGMQEHGAAAVRAKKQSSIVVGCRLVRDGQADAFFSAGNTGEMMAAGTLVTGRLPGVMRPAIGTALPTTGDPCVMLDVGANADCRPEHLVQFAHMGRAYAQAALGIAEPRVALLNIGEEPTKGSLLAQEAHALMADSVPGFTGNVALKLMEGLSKSLLGQVRDAMTSTAMRSMAAALLKPALDGLKARLDP